MGGKWTYGVPMLETRGMFHAVTYDDKIYSIGGRNETKYLQTMEIFELKTNKWNSISCPIRRYYFGAATVNGKIYVLGGYNSTTGELSDQEICNLVEIYDIASNTWSAGTNMPRAMIEFSCSHYKNKIYCIGGHSGGKPYFNDVFIYDTEKNTWTTGTPMPRKRTLSQTACVGSKVFCISGKEENGEHAYCMNVEAYDMDTDTWEEYPQTNIGGSSSCSVAINDKIHYLGTGTNWHRVLDTVNKFWKNEEAPPTSRNWFTSVTLNNKIYSIGHHLDRYNVTEIYTPDFTITERYLNSDGNDIQPQAAIALEPGDEYSKTSPRIPGYKRLGHRIDDGEASTTRTATIENVQQDHTVTFLYEPCDGEYCQDILITESYYDVVNDTYIRPDTYEYLAQGDDYRKLASSIPGYKRVGNRIDDGADMPGITAELLDVADDHHVHFLYEPGDEEPGLDVPIIEKYFDLASNTYIRPDTTTYVELGGTYRKTAPAIAGYQRVGHRVDAGPSSSSLTAVIADVRETHVVTFLYEPEDEGGTIPPGEAVIITERYFDVENQSFIQSDTYTRVRKGADYEKTAPAITGYDRIGHQIDGGAAQTSLTAQIMDVQESHVVTFFYEPDEGGGIDPGDKIVITEEYYDVMNRTYIQPDTQTRVDRGADYQKTAPSLSDYHRLGHQVDGGTPQGSFTARIDNVQETHTVTFLYQPDDGGGSTEPPEDGILITERYYDIVSRKYLLSDTYTKVARGTTYQKTAPAISGYFRVGHRIDNGADQTPIIAVIQNVQEPHVVTFLYEPAIDCDDFVIRERYYDKQNDVYIRPDTETLVEPGGDYRKTAPEITGYKRVGHKVDNGSESTSLTAVIENVRDDHTVTFLYIPDDGGSGDDEFVITERYYDVENSLYIRPDTHTPVKAGDDYAKTAPALIGYERIGHRVNDGNESAELAAIILNVRETHTVTFLYKPEDDDGGKDPGPDPGDGNRCCYCCKCTPMMMCMPVMPMMFMPWGNGRGCCSCGKPMGCAGNKLKVDNADDCLNR